MCPSAAIKLDYAIAFGQRMDEGFARKLTLISAPAGFGKTTLCVDGVHRHKILKDGLPVCS